MAGVEAVPDRHVVPAPGQAVTGWEAWIEAGLRVRVEVVEWAHREVAWFHLALPFGAPIATARRFDGARTAARPGAPDGLRERPMTGADAARLVSALVGLIPARLFRQRELDLVSRPGEDEHAFRKRCMAPLAQHAREGGREVAALLGRIAATIESRDERGDLVMEHARIGVVWYPRGMAPARPRTDPMVHGEEAP